MTQPDIVLNHLRSRPITPVSALVSHGIYRLGDAIFRLRKRGYRITTTMKVDAAGHKYAEYHLESEPQF